MSVLLPMLVALLGLVTPIAVQDRRSRDEPEMMLNAGGRTGTCDVLAFDAGGKWLFTGGDDKVIRAWQAGDAGLTDRTKTYRWPGWREQRGGIKTLSLASDGRVLVAGLGLKTGLVMLLDRDGEVLATNNVAGSVPEMPRSAIFASVFGPTEKAAIFGDSAGGLWRWDLKGPAVRFASFPATAGRPFNRVLALRFADERTLVAVAESGAVLRVTNPFAILTELEWLPNANTALPEEAVAARDSRLARAVISPDGRRVVGLMAQRHAVVLDLQGGKGIHLDAGAGKYFRSVAIDPVRDRLALAVLSPALVNDFLLPRDAEIQIHTGVFAGEGKLAATLPHALDAEVMTFHPTDGRLFVAGGDNHDLGVWDLTDPAKPKRQRGITGHGRSIWSVRISNDGKSFAWQTRRDPKAADVNALGSGPWDGFDMNFGRPINAAPLAGLRTEADGWRIVPSDTSRFVWLAVRDAGGIKTELELTLDPDRDQAPTCYCFLPPVNGQPIRVAIGHLYGFSIFELGLNRAERVVVATGHAGEVRSLAVSADGSWILTGGRDETIAGWSLKPWASGRFGAALAVRGRELLVEKVDLGGPAWEMGLRENDRITDVGFTAGGKAVSLLMRDGEPTLATPQMIENAVSALRRATPGVEYGFYWKRPGETQRRQGLTTMRLRPLWRFFPAHDADGRWTEWVAWTWRGSRYATSPGGDWLVGFQLNDPFTILGGRPRFFEAGLFRQSLHQPRGVLRLMQQRDIARMLVDEYGENPLPPSIGDRQPMPIKLGLSRDRVGPDGIRASVAIEMFSSNPDLMPQTVELWVNDHRVSAANWPQDRRSHSIDIDIPASHFRGGENQVSVVSINDAGGRAIERTTVMNDRKPKRPNIAGLLVGINDYATTRVGSGGRRDEFSDLKFAGVDARQLGESWIKHAGEGRYYGSQGVVVLSEKQATRKEILRQLAELKTRVTSDDVAVIFLAGHGHWVDRPGAGGKNRRKPPKMFVFCCRDFNPEKPLETGISDEELVLALAECPARKLLLLDACHSGQTASDSVIRHLTPAGQGPAIIAACDQQESSLEHDAFGHGLFTAAVIEALTTNFNLADRGPTRDNLLDPQELYDYLGNRIRDMLLQIDTTPTRQQPRSYPLDLPRFAIAQGKGK